MEINLGDLGVSPAMMRKFQENYGKGIAAPKKAKKAAGKKKKPVGRRRGQPVAAKSPSTGRGTTKKLPGSKRLQDILDIKKAPKPPKPPTSGLDPSVRQRLKDLFDDADARKGGMFGGSGFDEGGMFGGSGFAYKPPPSSGNKTVYTAGGSGGIVASQESRDRQAAIVASDLYPEIQSANRALNKYVKEKHGNSENSAESDPAYQKMVKDLFALQDQAAGGSGGPQPRNDLPVIDAGPDDTVFVPTSGSMPRTGQPGGPQPGTGIGDGPTSGSGGGSFESAYIDWMESEPKAPPVRRGMSVSF